MEAIQNDTLLVGNVSYLNADDIRNMLLDRHVVVCSEGAPTKKKKGNIKWYSVGIFNKKFEKVFKSHDFANVIYFSDYLTYHSKPEKEFEQIHEVLECCRKNKVENFIYITSQEIRKERETSIGRMQKSIEELCEFYAEKELINIHLIHSPYLVQPANENDYLNKLFSKASKNKKVELDYNMNDIPDFIDIRDLATLIYRLFDNLQDSQGISVLDLRPYQNQSFKDLKVRMLDYFPEVSIDFVEKTGGNKVVLEEDIAKKEYSWQAKYGLIRNFDMYYETWKNSKKVEKNIFSIIADKLHSENPIVSISEVLVGALIVELLNKLYEVSAQFKYIDFRLLFVIIIATVYGTKLGFIAAVLEIISLGYAFTTTGSKWELLLYEPKNWLPFLFFIIAAGVCGYIKQKHDDDFEFAGEENKSLKEKNDFLEEIYNEAMQYKNEYKQELIESRDGFGRIFDVVKRLSNTVPARIYAESIPVIEEILDTKSIAIFSIQDPQARFGRLEVASQGIRNKVGKSIELSNYKSIIEEIDKSEIWVNKKLEEGYPLYMTGIKDNGQYVMLIAIYHTSYVHMSAYYANLIRILRGLLENFLVKAWEYQKAYESEIYIDGTSIVTNKYFVEQLQIQRDMADRHLTHFRLIQVLRNGMDIKQINTILQTSTRSNDIVGVGADNNIYILAAQVDHNTIQYVLDRLTKVGLECKVVSEIGE
ncbi:hypothetical protein [Lachnobacterium bovis]|nr:hypothetical protein [Lachnobacterium bovis]